MKRTENLISIVVDTNVCYVSEKKCEFDHFYLSTQVSNLDAWIQFVRNEKIQIVIPEMTIRELKKQRCDWYSKKKKELLDYMNNNTFPDIKINFDVEEEFDYSNYIEQQIYEFFRNSKTIVNTMPITFDVDSIVNRAIDKKAPFEGKEKQSDKGFKDAVIWESLLAYKRNNPYRKIVYYSKDNRFCKELQEEYQNIFGEEIDIINSDDDALKYILQNLENDVPELQKKLDEYIDLKQYIYNNMPKIKELYVEHMRSGAWGKIDSIYVADIEFTNLYFKKFVRGKIVGEYVAEFCTHIKLGVYGLEIQERNMEFMVEIDVGENQTYNMRITGSWVGSNSIL